jgi:hypothetical protein
MARRKELYLKDACSHLAQATNILTDANAGEIATLEIQTVRAAAIQAEQAAATLRELVGVLDAESNLPKRESTRSSRIGPDRYRS